VTLDIHAAAPPLTVSEGGVVRVTGTRIALDVIVEEYDAGASAEDLVLRYPSLDLSDTYAVISFVLRDRSAVDAYLAERATPAEARTNAVPDGMTRIRDRMARLRDLRE